MNRKLRMLMLAIPCLTFSFIHAQNAGEIKSIIEHATSRAQEQALLLAKTLEEKKEALPRTFENGKIVTCRYNHWVSGFFPGVLWMLYEDSGLPEFKKYAELYTTRVEPAKHMRSTHDLGFMLFCSYGHAYRLTGKPHYRDVILEGSRNLITRWHPRLGVMRSWDTTNKNQWQFPVIIDNMMNLEMLCFATKETGDKNYVKIAETHANTTLKHHFRNDYSTFHVVSYDTISGKPHAKHTAQGYSHASAWARGQAWGLYGYTMMYRETGKKVYLKQARKIASYLTEHPNLPADKVPYWDYNAPNILQAKRDASAAAIMASALLQLSQLDKSGKSKLWFNVATQQLRTLCSTEYLAEKGENGGFILKHGVGHMPNKTEVDVPLTYADYYFVEALMLLKNFTKETPPQKK